MNLPNVCQTLLSGRSILSSSSGDELIIPIAQNLYYGDEQRGDVPLLVFLYLVFTRMPGESGRGQFKSRAVVSLNCYTSEVCRPLRIPFVGWFIRRSA